MFFCGKFRRKLQNTDDILYVIIVKGEQTISMDFERPLSIRNCTVGFHKNTACCLW